MVLVRLDDGRSLRQTSRWQRCCSAHRRTCWSNTPGDHPPDDVRATNASGSTRTRRDRFVSHRSAFRRRDGAYLTTRTRVSVSEDDGILFAIHHIEDVTEERRTAEQLTHAARHDELTGLTNRSYFMQVLEQRLTGSRPGLWGSSLSILTISKW